MCCVCVCTGQIKVFHSRKEIAASLKSGNVVSKWHKIISIWLIWKSKSNTSCNWRHQSDFWSHFQSPKRFDLHIPIHDFSLRFTSMYLQFVLIFTLIPYFGIVARYATSLRRSSGLIRSWLLRAGKVRIGPPRLSLPPSDTKRKKINKLHQLW